MKAIKRLSQAPSGVVFVVGPTGSGKTTTLFSMLQAINTPDRNILTIEDPVEYKLDGAGQLQVNPMIKVTFGTALRSFLRQDPDVILVGEIRDVETAEISLRAGLTGHLVFSSMHTNDALQTIMRLMDFGVENFNVAAPIAGVLYQRLVRSLCSQCKEPYTVNPEVVEQLFEADGEPVLFHRAKGCPSCNYQGYKGRLAVHELFQVNDAAREVINRGGEMKELKAAAMEGGMQSFTYDGLKKVLRGLTSFEELRRVSGELYLEDDMEMEAKP
jgi:type II secretory ATPase GspE/PulE/Tfp pilus assembly ATPase PilB-like protein